MKILKSLSLATLLLALPALAPSAQSHSAGISGERAYARITRSKQALTVNPNQVGNFPTIDVVAQKSIKVEVIYPAGQANESVTLKALEGGNLGNGQGTKDVTLDNLKTATFYFTTGSGRGLYRVAVSKGADVKIVEFWVGEKLPVFAE